MGWTVSRRSFGVSWKDCICVEHDGQKWIGDGLIFRQVAEFPNGDDGVNGGVRGRRKRFLPVDSLDEV